MKRDIPVTVFEKPGLHTIRLGHISSYKGAPNLTVTEQPSGALSGFALTDEQAQFLLSLDPKTVDGSYTDEEQGLLLALGRRGGVAFWSDKDALVALDVVPVSRQPLSVVRETEDGYELRVGDGEPFELSDLGGRFFPFLASGRSIGEITLLVKEALLEDPVGREFVEQVEVYEQRPFDSRLADEALELIRVMTKSGAFTFEPTA